MADLVITATSVVAGTGALTEAGTLGATVTAGQAVYKDATTGKWNLADNNSATAAIRQAQGIALNGGAINQPVKVLRSGPLTLNAVLTAGTSYYLSDTPGGIGPFADILTGEYVCLLGIATSTTVLSVGIVYPGVVL